MAARKRGVRTIPQEIMTEILYRLPAKSVGRFRCVSKGWLSLLTDPNFIKTHKNITLNQHHLIFQPELDNEHYSGEKAPTKFNLESNRESDEFYFSSSCDGLVLVILQGCEGTLYLVNPTTRESLQLKYEVEMIEYLEDLNLQFLYGFGYDIVTDDYKVVLVTCFHGYTSDQEGADEVEGVCVYVYSLRNKTWKRLIDSPYHKHYDMHYETDGVFVNGFIHWIVRKGDDDNVLPLIAAFSLADESFSELPSPDFCNTTTNMFIRDDSQLVVLGGKLAIFIKSEAVVWLMNEYGVSESWTKISLHGINKIPIFKTERCRLPLLVLDDYCKIQVADNDRMMVYEAEKGTFSKTTVCVWNPKNFSVVYTYVESLVSLKPNITNQKHTNSKEVEENTHQEIYSLNIVKVVFSSPRHRRPSCRETLDSKLIRHRLAFERRIREQESTLVEKNEELLEMDMALDTANAEIESLKARLAVADQERRNAIAALQR